MSQRQLQDITSDSRVYLKKKCTEFTLAVKCTCSALQCDSVPMMCNAGKSWSHFKFQFQANNAQFNFDSNSTSEYTDSILFQFQYRFHPLLFNSNSNFMKFMFHFWFQPFQFQYRLRFQFLPVILVSDQFQFQFHHPWKSLNSNSNSGIRTAHCCSVLINIFQFFRSHSNTLKAHWILLNWTVELSSIDILKRPQLIFQIFLFPFWAWDCCSVLINIFQFFRSLDWKIFLTVAITLRG